MIYKTIQNDLFSTKNEELEYLQTINKIHSFKNAFKKLNEINWDFKDFKTQYLSHTFHSYPARFIPQIPLTFIKLFTSEGDTVLDPMCGCGTTLVEALLNNRNSIGNDFNPLAALIAKVKTTLIEQNKFNYLHKKLAVMKHYLDLDYKKVEKRIEKLPNRKASKIFDKVVISKLECIRETLIELKEEDQEKLFDFGRTALSSTIWSLVENGGGIDLDNLFLRKINSMRKELISMNKIIKNNPSVDIICGDSRRLEIADKTVDLIVTSPPYVNALDYYRTHMYNMLWLGMDFDLFKKHEIGGHSHFIVNRFRLLSEYLGDMLRSMIEMNRTLKEGKLCVIVVGNSSLEYELIESYKFFAEMCKEIGFEPLKSIFRNIDKTRKYTNADVGKIDDEYILVLKKLYDIDISADDDDFISKVVKDQMLRFEEQIKKVQGTSIKGREPTKKRLLKNIDKVRAAIETVPGDIKIR